MLHLDARGRRTGHPALLLEHMRELVCHQPLTCRRCWLVVSFAEHYVVPTVKAFAWTARANWPASAPVWTRTWLRSCPKRLEEGPARGRKRLPAATEGAILAA